MRLAGGFTGDADAPIMTAQIQLDDVDDAAGAPARIAGAHRRAAARWAIAPSRAWSRAAAAAATSSCRVLDAAAGAVVVELHVDVGDAMGANLVDTVAEAVAPRVAELLGGEVGLRILSNLALRRLVRARAEISVEALGGDALADGVVRASRFAELDLARAATHNKGIMNGIDAAAVALGQDWRAHRGRRPRLRRDRADATGRWRPGGAPPAAWSAPSSCRWRSAPSAAAPAPRACAPRSSWSASTARAELAVVLAAVGLASNLAALRALAGEGIQRGHMKLHARRLEVAAPKRCPKEVRDDRHGAAGCGDAGRAGLGRDVRRDRRAATTWSTA